MLIHSLSVIDKPVYKIYFYYLVWQRNYDELQEKLGDLICFKNELDLEEPEPSRENKTTAVIFDDMHLVFKQNKQLSYQILNYYTIYSHHKDLITFFLTQSMFINNDIYRTLSQNSNYFILFKNFLNSLQINTLATQIYGSKEAGEDFLAVYEKIMENGEKFNYIVICLHPLAKTFTMHTQIIPTDSLQYNKIEKIFKPSKKPINKAKKIKLN